MTNNWLKQRSEILAKYADCLPIKQDRICMIFSYPEYGWMPLHFHKNGEDMGFIELSSVYDCFEPMREWLECIAENSHSKASIVNLDCEIWHAVLYYEPVWFYDQENYKGKLYPPHYGIFSVYDEADDKFIIDAFCDTETFVQDLDKCMVDFAEEMKEKPEFIEDWVADSWNHEWGELDDDDPRIKEIFINKIKSPAIEKYINKMDSWHRENP